MKLRFRVAFLFLALAAASAAFGQKLKPGPQVLTFFSDVDDTDQPYALYLPKNFNSSKKYPLVISLHGAGSNHRLNLRRVFGQSNRPGESDVEATRYFPQWRDLDFIVASPLARGTMSYQGIAELSDRLPIQFNPSVTDYGLVYVFPLDGHYILVSSGKPWWQSAPPGESPRPAEPATRRRFSFLPGAAGALSAFKDYVLFKDSPENVVAEGRFDENWRLPEADAEKMRSTGTVTINDNH